MAINDAEKPMTSAHSVGRDTSEMREILAERRASLSGKLGALETQIEDRILQAVDRMASDVEHSVHKVTTTVDDSVEQMGAVFNESLGHLRSSLQATMGRVDNSIQDFVEGVGNSIDVRRQFDERPVAMFGLSVFAGLVIGRLLKGGRLPGNPLH